MRRSMEDEARPLPHGWVRQYDSKAQHQFFVDTTAEPPRSIWHHPYDDETYLSSLSPSEREEIQKLHRVPTHADIEAESFADDEHHHHSTGVHEAPPKGVHKLGRRVKDKLTHSTHEEREARRREREEEERRAYAQHQHFRTQMAKAAEIGTPQLLGKDRDGKDVYIEPPGGPGGYGYGGGGAYGYNPYNQGPYGDPNAKFIRPPNPYERPYGYGYGGGYGLPLLGLGGGLLLGGLLF
jgi:hypothetical protein